MATMGRAFGRRPVMAYMRKEVTMAVVAYCVKCKEKKEMVDPQEGVTKNGRVITKGTCPTCGTKMSLIGGVAK